MSALSSQAIETFKRLFNETILADKMTAYLADIAYSWKIIAICSGTSIVLGYLYLLIIRCIGALIVWLSIFLIQAALIAGGAYTYFQSQEYLPGSDYEKWLKYAAYGIFGVAVLYCICICCCWKAIRIGIAVYQATAEYVSKNVRIFLLPIISYFFAFIWFLTWGVSAIFVFSVGEPKPRPGYEFITEMQWSDQTRYVAFYQIFMLFWINAFIMGIC